MRLSRRGIIVALIVALAGAGVVYGSVRLLSGETVLYLEPDNPGPDPFTDPAVFDDARRYPVPGRHGVTRRLPVSHRDRLPRSYAEPGRVRDHDDSHVCRASRAGLCGTER
jgi:hypothetical protein